MKKDTLSVLVVLAGFCVSVAAQVSSTNPISSPTSAAVSGVPLKVPSTIKAWKMTYGTYDQAAVMSVTAGSATEPLTQVLGFTSPSQLSTYSNRDSVALYAANLAAAPLVTTRNTVFTSTSVSSPDFAGIRTSLREGMIIDAYSGRTRLSGMIVSWTENTVKVSNWYIVDGSRNTGTPANGSEVRVSPPTKVWAANLILEIPSSATATNSGTGLELDVGAIRPAVASGVVGEDLVNIYPAAVSALSQARGAANYGYYSETGKTWAYRSDLGSETNFIAYQNGSLPGARVNYWSYPYEGATLGAKFGFRSTRDQKGFTAENPTVSAYTTEINGSTRFNVNNQGQIDGSYFHYEPINAANVVLSEQAVFVVNIYNGATVSLPSPSVVGAGKLITFVTRVPCTANRVSLSANQTITWISDGANWITVNFGSTVSPSSTRGMESPDPSAMNRISPEHCREHSCSTNVVPAVYRETGRTIPVNPVQTTASLPSQDVDRGETACTQYPCIVARVAPALYSGRSGLEATTLYTAPSAGMYRLCAFLRTTVAGRSGTLQIVSLPYVSDGATTGSSRVVPATSVGLVGSTSSGCSEIYVDSGTAIQWAMSGANVIGVPTVRYALTLERLQ